MGPLERAEADRQWNSVETKRLRAIDAAEMGLAARLAAMDKAEADAKVNVAREKILAAPPTDEELKILDGQRVVGQVKKMLNSDLSDVAALDNAAFTRALSNVPQGFADGLDLAAHLRALRLGQPEPVVEIEPEPDNTGLHRLLEGKV